MKSLLTSLSQDIKGALTWRHAWVVMLAGLFLRLLYATLIPLGADEVYYWDWGRLPHLSYMDHPPGVGALAWLSQQLAALLWQHPPIYLAARLLVPCCHLAAALLLMACATRLKGGPLSEAQSRAAVLLAQTVPAFALGGFFLLPDAGLYLFATLAIYLLLLFLQRESLTFWHGAVVGAVWGLAFLCKYHAVPLAAGALAVFGLRRRRGLGTFALGCIVVGLLMTLPVWYWNAQHEWISFRYQGGRGLGKSLRLTPALRVILGEIIFLSPLVVWALVVTTRRAVKQGLWQRTSLAIIAVSSLAMFSVIKIFSFSSQTLPHWTMPAFWLLIAPLALAWPTLTPPVWLKRLNVFLLVVILVVVPALLGSAAGRDGILKFFSGRVPGLSEMVLWDNLSRDEEFLKLLQRLRERALQRVASEEKRQACTHLPQLASFRWFSIAYAAFYLPGQPQVAALDHKPSYYTVRDAAQVEERRGCPVVFVGEKAHWDEERAALVDVQEEIFYEHPLHKLKPLAMGAALWR